MNKEILNPKIELESLATGLAGTFIQRRDLYARQTRDGSYICIRSPLETSHLVAHLKGELTLGAYVLDPSSQASYIVFDADDDDQAQALDRMAKCLADQNVPAYMEGSRRGGHLWLFFAKPVSGKQARLFGQNLLELYGVPKLELFPKQAKLSEGPGSLIRLPFGVHRKTGLRYGFYTLDHHPLTASQSEQIHILCAPERVPEAFVKQNSTRPSSKPPKPVYAGTEESKKPLSERIKQSITVRDFVSQFVELSPAGRGLCPFHDDQNSSFAVNAEGNYWHCFAGCGGGSIIDFWMKMKNCDFKTAVRELANMLP
jgi:hypothetical protein